MPPVPEPASMNPAFILAVASPTLYPVPSTAGQLWVVTPADPVDTITVTSPDGGTVIRSAAVPPGVLYGAILNLVLDGAVTFLRPIDAQLWHAA